MCVAFIFTFLSLSLSHTLTHSHNHPIILKKAYSYITYIFFSHHGFGAWPPSVVIERDNRIENENDEFFFTAFAVDHPLHYFLPLFICCPYFLLFISTDIGSLGITLRISKKCELKPWVSLNFFLYT